VQALSGGQTRREDFVVSLLSELCPDPDVIAFRARAVDNLLEDPTLRQGLANILPALSAAVRERDRSMYGYQWTPGLIVERLGDLELYLAAAEGLSEALDASPPGAPALGALRGAVQSLVQSEEFLSLGEELPALRERLEKMQSVTIGVNLAGDLRPESATILSVDPEKIEGRGGLLDRLLGEEAAKRGITKLRGDPGRSLRSLFPPMQPDAFGRENELVRDLRRLIEGLVGPVGDAIDRFGWARTRAFARLEAELSFLLNAAALIERLRGAGLPVSRPEIAPAEGRGCYLEGAYNASLALRLGQSEGFQRAGEEIVTNTVRFDGETSRVWILTGPNRGGKTTYSRAVGLAQVLFQAGLHVPARCGRISPADAVYTHFPRPETAALGEGRLDDEAIRLAEIFRAATPHSLVLINEGLSGTSTLESLALARDAVRGFCLLGARVVYVTHLHELAAQVEEINRTAGGRGAGSLVAGVESEREGSEDGHRRTFRIRPGPPLGLSYASEIAEQHGVSYRQIQELLRRRGLVPD
jgi:hypothetical protein